FLGEANVLPVEVRGREIYLPGGAQPLVTDAIHASGRASLYVRPNDLRIAQPGRPGIEVVVESVVRTGPLVRAEARSVEDGRSIQVEIPHLHHDTEQFVPGARLRLRLLQFSVFPAEGAEARAAEPAAAPGTGRPPAVTSA